MHDQAPSIQMNWLTISACCVAALLAAGVVVSCVTGTGADTAQSVETDPRAEIDSGDAPSKKETEQGAESEEEERSAATEEGGDAHTGVAPDEHMPPYDREYDISEVYAEACVDCHGEDGDGDGTVEQGFSFGSESDEWTNGPTVDGILITLDDGIHDTAMQEFPQFLDDDRVELAEYVLELRYELTDGGP